MGNQLATQSNTAVAMREEELIQVLGTSLYPGANPDSIRMVLGYCKAAQLDPIQKPVHIVPMWSSVYGRMIDVVMPGIGLYRTQAARNGCAGVSEPEFGPDVTEVIGGASVTFPAWCKVTVKRRLDTGEVVDFTSKEFWKENYAVKGGKEKSIAPNAMWSKRPYGQLAKCSEAQALRKAFPEIGSQPTADEMEGKTMTAEDVAIRHTPTRGAPDEVSSITQEREMQLRAACNMAIEIFDGGAGDEVSAYEQVSGVQDGDEKLFVWNFLKSHSALRASIKKQDAADRASAVEDFN